MPCPLTVIIMRNLLIFLFIHLSVNSCSSQVSKDKTAYGKLVPVMLGIHNEHGKPDSLKIEIIDSADSLAFFHQGALEGWGMRMTDKQIQTGKYKLILSWYKNNKSVKTQKEIVIQPETELFSLNIELANEPARGRTHNAIYLDQYTNSLPSVEFNRIWDPQEQFKKDTLLLPEYEVTNKNDSTIYGAYLRFSSMLSINWVQPHYIAFMRLEQKTDSGWISLGCNAPRIEMNLKKGAAGKTLKDMVLGCAINFFKPGETYRVSMDYMFNNRIYQMNPSKDNFEENIYVEQTIYRYTDEFKLK
jgi:hypothetical protein